MIVPDNQMDSLKIICAADADNTFVSLVKVPKFEKGQLVRVIDGAFKGVTGRVARWHGQQRVGVVVDDLVTMATAYIPSAFLEKNIIKQTKFISMKKFLTFITCMVCIITTSCSNKSEQDIERKYLLVLFLCKIKVIMR